MPSYPEKISTELPGLVCVGLARSFPEKSPTELPIEWDKVSMSQSSDSAKVGQTDIYAEISRDNPELELLTP